MPNLYCLVMFPLVKFVGETIRALHCVNATHICLGYLERNRNDSICVAAPKVAKASIVHLTATDGLAKNVTNVHEHVLSVTPTRTALALATLGAMRETDILAKNFTNVHDHVLSVTATRTVLPCLP
jgi:hypothetical protein